jgi:hypothetical protein
MSACRACPAGTAGPSSNASPTSCEACDLPFFSPAEASRVCSSCNAGLYAVFDDAGMRLFRECRFCPAGADCPALDNMTISPRYYAVRNATTLLVETFLCDGDRCGANFSCGPNRLPADANPLCGQCAHGFSEWSGACVSCPGADGGLVLGLLLLAWLCVMVIHGLSQSTSSSSSLRIAMFFWQVALLIVGRAAWARWAAAFDLNLLAGGATSACPFPISAHGMLVLLLLGPLLTFALLCATAALHRGLQAVLLSRERGNLAAAELSVSDKAPEAGTRSWPLSAVRKLRLLLMSFEATAYYRTAISLYFFTFNSVTRACLDFFSCTAVPGGRYMVALPAVRCDEDAYRTLAPIPIALLAAYCVAAPCWIAINLRSARTRNVGALQAPGAGEHHVRVWSVVYGPFRAGVYWWGLAQMLARAALVAAAVFLRADDGARYGTLSLLCLGLVVLLLLLRPNRSKADNAWELVTLLALAILSITASMGGDATVWLEALLLGVGSAAALRVIATFVNRVVTGVRAKRQRDSMDGSSERTRGSSAEHHELPALPLDGYVMLGNA